MYVEACLLRGFALYSVGSLTELQGDDENGEGGPQKKDLQLDHIQFTALTEGATKS